MLAPARKPKTKLSDLKKAEIEKRCQPLVEQFITE
jgi:hypothetical protein